MSELNLICCVIKLKKLHTSPECVYIYIYIYPMKDMIKRIIIHHPVKDGISSLIASCDYRVNSVDQHDSPVDQHYLFGASLWT